LTTPKYAVDEPGKGRHYWKPGTDTRLPSITNILRRHNKPAINVSMVTKAAHYTVDNWERLTPLTPQERVTLIRESQFEKSEASITGDIVHNWIERRITGDTPSHDEVQNASNTVRWMWNSFLKWEAHYSPQYTGSEFTVWSDKYGYAGTGDLSFYIGDWHVLADTKTGKGVYPETAAQIAAIAKAEVIITDAGEFPVPKYDKFAILHVRPRGATLVPVYHIPEAFEYFLALKKVFDWEMSSKDHSLGRAPKVT
jgi:hypothetical protein